MFTPLVESAFEYTYPLFAVANTRHRAVADTSNPRRHGINTLLHEKQLSDHTARWITAPNNDTLYSNAWLDLARGPVRVRVRAMGADRYWSVAFLDAFSNNFAMLGQRLDGNGPVEVTLVGPSHYNDRLTGRVIRAPGHDVWLLARVLVDGPHDLVNAYAMQNNLDVWSTMKEIDASRTVPVNPIDAKNFLEVVNDVLGSNPVPPEDTHLVRNWHIIGIRPGLKQVWDQIDGPARRAWSDNIPALYDRLKQAGSKGRRNVQGWITAGPEIGNFGCNYALRASVALGGLGALEPAEASYFVKFHDHEMRLLDGRNRYRLTVPSSGIPADSFWSFSMYAPTTDGKRFFVDNPIKRYSIGNRTTGLVLNDDGSIDLLLQNDPPTDPKQRANWLPTPKGTFQIALRAYLPSPELRAGTATMPGITLLSE